MNFTVRLNMKNPAHRQAWERLKVSGSSYTETIVKSLNAPPESARLEEWKETLCAAIRETLAEAMSQLPALAPINNSSSDPATISGISDEDFDIANEFMNCL